MTKAIILAAGQGTRLRPLTDNIPKCLVPLAGVSLLERQVSTLQEAGITRINIVSGYRSECIEELGFDVTLNHDYAKTNMVESLFAAKDFMMGDQEDLIIAYGDIVYEINNLKALLDSEEDIALMIDTDWKKLWSLRLENPLEDAETLIIDSDGYVTELGKKPKSYEFIQGQYTGLIKIAGSKFNDLWQFYKDLDRKGTYDNKDFNNMYMTSFLQQLIDNGWKAKAVLVKNGWLEVDSVEDLECYESLAKENGLDQFYRLQGE